MKSFHSKTLVALISMLLIVATSGLSHGQSTVLGTRLHIVLPNQGAEDVVVIENSLLIVDAGSYQYVIKVDASTGQQSSVRIAKCSFQYNQTNRIYTLNRVTLPPTTLAFQQSTTIGGSTNPIQVTFDGVAEMRTRPEPIGACKGNCCKATCFTINCCNDLHECFGTNCNCKPKGPCPPMTGGTTFAISSNGTLPFPPVHAFVQLFSGNNNQLIVQP
jgi:hypothetical protein